MKSSGSAGLREEAIAAALLERGVARDVALVLGSGLGPVVDRMEVTRTIPFGEVAGMPAGRVPGHAGRFVLGELSGVGVLVQQGRVHAYEGWGASAVTASVRAFARIGVRSLILTNAAGAIEPGWRLPGLMRITDHMSFQRRPTLRRGEEGRGSPYDPELARVLDGAARESGVELRSGVYAATLGPAYETPGEIALFARLGAHAVGMSTVAEASAGRVAGLRVAAVSCLTNPAAGVARAPLSHAEVVAAGGAMAEDFTRLLAAAVPRAAAP